MEATLTKKQQLISKKFLVYKFLTSLWFISSVWLYFYRLFISDREAGILDALAFAIGLIAEVPSGVLADKFGRDKMVKWGQLLTGIGLLTQAFGSHFLAFVIGQSVMMIGVSFVSGADEALFFDQLNFKKDSNNWRKLLAKGAQISLIASTSATVLGGIIHKFNPRLVWVLTAFAFISSTISIWSIREDKLKEAKPEVFKEEINDHLKSMVNGFKYFFKPKLFLYVPIIFAVQGIFYTTGFGILRIILLDRFGFSPFAGSLVIASSSLITIATLDFLNRKAEKVSEKLILILISFLTALSLLASIFKISYWGYFVILFLYVGEHVLYPFLSEIINYRSPGKQRATILSVASFLKTIPYVFLAPLIGFLNTKNQLGIFLLSWTVLIIISIFVYLLLSKRDKKISIDVEIGEELRVPEL